MPNTVAVDLAKSIFEVAVSEHPGRVRERLRLTRPQFERFIATRTAATIVMEACTTAHFWGRHVQAHGHLPILLPPHAARPYVPPQLTDPRRAAPAALHLARHPHQHRTRPVARARHLHPARCSARRVDPARPPRRRSSRARSAISRSAWQTSDARSSPWPAGLPPSLACAPCPGIGLLMPPRSSPSSVTPIAFRPDATSRATSASPRASPPALCNGAAGRLANAATLTCAYSSRARSPVLPLTRQEDQGPSTTGRSMSSSSVTTTRQPSPWPTSSLASPGR
jgi:hypothetical protein